MKIAALLNVHDDPELIEDTISSIRTYMTDQILVVVDKAGINKFREWSCSFSYMEGLWHGSPNSPYRNMTLGLKTLYGSYDADWYCYLEYDTLIASEDFQKELSVAKNGNIFLLGSDHRQGNYDLRFFERILRTKISSCHCILGCCLFFRKEFLAKLKEIDFFDRLLYYTNGMNTVIPGITDCGAHDVAEVVYPSMAIALGGSIKELSRWSSAEIGWSGDFERYPMRFRPEIMSEFEMYPEATIVHPVKRMDHYLRKYYREKRERTGRRLGLLQPATPLLWDHSGRKEHKTPSESQTIPDRSLPAIPFGNRRQNHIVPPRGNKEL